MSWFTKKKAVEDEKKESSVLTIETMHEDLEDKTEDSGDKKAKETDLPKKIEKKSPFLMGNIPQEKELVAESKPEDKKDEPSLQIPTTNLANKTEKVLENDISNTKDSKSLDITKTNEKIDSKKEESPFKSLLNKKDSPEEKAEIKEESPEETDEDKMEKIVKAGNTGPIKKVSENANPDIVVPAKKIEEAIYIDRTRQKGSGSLISEKKEENNKSLLNGGLVSTGGGTTGSPFGVPKKGISPAETNKDADKNKTKSNIVKKFNKPLLLLAIIVFVLTLVAVAITYYRNSQEKTVVETSSITTKETSNNVKYTKDNFAGTGIVLKTSKELLLSDLKAFVKKEKAINPAKFIGGQFIRPLQKETEYITGAEVLKIFGSEDSAINTFLDEPAMLFVTEEVIDVENSTDPSLPEGKNAPSIETKNAVKVALVLELKGDTEPGDVIERLTEIETTFPGTLKSLMIEEDIKIANEKIVFNQASPERKDFVHTIRYYNFKYGNVTRSIEWGSLLYKNKSYIFFSTSKEATNSLIKALY